MPASFSIFCVHKQTSQARKLFVFLFWETGISAQNLKSFSLARTGTGHLLSSADLNDFNSFSLSNAVWKALKFKWILFPAYPCEGTTGQWGGISPLISYNGFCDSTGIRSDNQLSATWYQRGTWEFLRTQYIDNGGKLDLNLLSLSPNVPFVL